MAGTEGSAIDREKIFVTKIFRDTSFRVRMKKQDLQNERLDEIGIRLLDTARLRSDEIEDVASAPHLFNSVRARIKAEQMSRETPSSWTSVWPGWGIKLVYGSAAAAVLVSALIFLFIPRNDRENVDAPRAFAGESPVANPPSVAVAPPAVNENIVATHVPHRKISAGNAVSHTRRSRPQREEMTEFYALTYDDDPDDDIRIIRVELPRSSLLAMGINAHAETESEKVKADLVVGADGVARAVRFAK